MKILVAEDGRLLNNTLCYNLSVAGYIVDVAMTKSVAMQFNEKQDYDLIVLDVNLPDGDGFDFCKNMKERRPDTAVIFLTARDMESDQLHGFELGADDYVTKPFPMSVFQKKVAALLARISKQNGGDCYDDGYLFINFSEMRAMLVGRSVIFTPMEYRLSAPYYQDLLTKQCVQRPYQTQRNDVTVSARNVREIHKVLRCAFNQAVKWELMQRNPVAHATLPKTEAAKRDIWTSEILFKALSLCDDDMLALALNLAFSCSLRMGEMLGLTWNCLQLDEQRIANGTASIYVDKELQRVSKETLEKLDGKGVVKIFPGILASKHTALILKEPKTKTSIRTVYLPNSVAEMLIRHKKEQDELKELLGNEYIDYDLVFASTNGRPVEGQIINRAFSKLIRENDLPKVVFHSLRHSSITYKLKLNGGDMKSVQGDSGHAQLKMVADVYSHIIDEDRCKNAQNFEKAIYSGQVDEKTTEPQAESNSDKLIRLLSSSPAFADELLKKLGTLAL